MSGSRLLYCIYFTFFKTLFIGSTMSLYYSTIGIHYSHVPYTHTDNYYRQCLVGSMGNRFVWLKPGSGIRVSGIHGIRVSIDLIHSFVIFLSFLLVLKCFFYKEYTLKFTYSIHVWAFIFFHCFFVPDQSLALSHILPMPDEMPPLILPMPSAKFQMPITKFIFSKNQPNNS